MNNINEKIIKESIEKEAIAKADVARINNRLIYCLSQTYKNISPGLLYTELVEVIKEKMETPQSDDEQPLRILTLDFSIDQDKENIAEMVNNNEVHEIRTDDVDNTLLGYKIYDAERNIEIINIDHHARTPEMSRRVSTGSLVKKYVDQYGPVDDSVVTVIHHGDADSVLSALMIQGHIPAEEKFSQAAIDGDHTGARNLITDTLMAIQHLRSNTADQLEFSYQVLNKLLENEDVLNTQYLQPDLSEDDIDRIFGRYFAPEVVAKLISRHRDRQKLVVLSDPDNPDGFKYIENADGSNSGIYFVQQEDGIAGELLPAALPEARIIILTSINPEYGIKKNAKRYNTKIRLGMKNKEGDNLQKIVYQYIPEYGGRWNAGSDKRSGGTDLPAKEVAKKVVSLLPNPQHPAK